jgi:hypothetical protein
MKGKHKWCLGLEKGKGKKQEKSEKENLQKYWNEL